MTKLKPSIPPSVLQELSNKIEEQCKQNAELLASASTAQEPAEKLSPPLPFAPDFSADRYNNGLRTVRITGVDGIRRVHRYRARAPAGSASCTRPNHAEVSAQTVESLSTIEQLARQSQLALPQVPTTEQTEEDEKDENQEDEEITSPAEMPHLETSMASTTPASLTPELSKARLQLDPEQQGWSWKITHLLISSFLMLVIPWRVAKYLVLPWFISRVLRLFQGALPPIVDDMPATLRGLQQDITTMAPRIYEILAPPAVVFMFGFLMPWNMRNGFYVCWMVIRGLELAVREGRSVLLASHLTILVIFPVVVWTDLVPWMAWRLAGVFMFVFLFSLVPRFTLRSCSGQ